MRSAIPPRLRRWHRGQVRVRTRPARPSFFMRRPQHHRGRIEHHRDHPPLSRMVNPGSTLLLYPDHPWKIGELYGYDYDPETQRRERFSIAQPEDLD